jgi:poly-gamma-glutamate synthesis protein (capsule biosynthesis protein)
MFKLLFAGDFAPCSRYESIVINKGCDVFGDLKEYIIDADFAFVNLETPLCYADKEIVKIGPSLRASPKCVEALSKAGFDVVGLANNHIYDFGEEGIKETLQACKSAGLYTCGADINIFKAQKPLVIEKKGFKVAFIAVAEHEFSIARFDRAGASPLDPIDVTVLIEKSRKMADLVFVTIHGGNEYFEYPRPGLQKICRFFIDQGADGIICHHPHVPGAYEFYKDKPIVYSLGNLLFDHLHPPKGWTEGYAVQFKYDTNKKILIACEFIPYTQSVENRGVEVIKGDERQVFIDKLNSLNKILLDKKVYAKLWDDFCLSKESYLLFECFSPLKFKGVFRVNKVFNFLKYILEANIASRLNIVRCESHNEVLINILEKRC